MQTWIVLFRGINVGGKNVVPMAPLKASLEAANCKQVRTYIQSGNVVFRSAMKNRGNLSKRIVDTVANDFGFHAKTMLLTAEEFSAAVSANPFPKAAAAPKTLHFFFLDAVPGAPDIDSITDLATKTESFRLIGDVFYLHAPEGFGKSKLAKSVERKLGVGATARNYSTVDQISKMLIDS